MKITLEQQIKDWEAIHSFMEDARRMDDELQREFLHNEVYPKLREYAGKYNTKYDHLNKPK